MATKPLPVYVQQYGLTNTEELFETRTITELRAIEQQTRADEDKKRRDLRMMVGERYRDLIDAADSIVAMRKQSEAVKGLLSSLWTDTDAKELKKAIKSHVRQEPVGRDDERKQRLYGAAAQIKLLVEVPEQMWKSLESNQYLTASRLFLVSRLIYKNLLADNSENSSELDVESTFPVVQRQWDAISHFRSQIVQRATRYLGDIDVLSADVAKTLAAIIMLDNVTVMDVFETYLENRIKALESLLEAARSSTSAEIAESLEEIVEYLDETLQHVVEVFIRPYSPASDSTIIESYIIQLQQGFTIQEESTGIGSAAPLSSAGGSGDTSKSTMMRLYSTVTNVNLLIRYLPDSIQSFTPFLQADGPRGTVNKPVVKTATLKWLESAISKLQQSHLDRILSNIADVSGIFAVRRKILQKLSRSMQSTTKIKGSSDAGLVESTEPKLLRRRSKLLSISVPKRLPWNQTCDMLFEKQISLWDDLFKSSFNRRTIQIWEQALAQLSQLPDEMLEVLLKTLDSTSMYETDLSLLLWSKEETVMEISNVKSRKKLVETLKDKMHHRTPLLSRYLDRLDTICQTCYNDATALLRGDFEPFCKGLSAELVSEETSDLRRLRDQFNDKVQEAMTNQAMRLRFHFDRSKDDRQIEKQLFIGRVALGSSRNVSLAKLCPDQAGFMADFNQLYHESYGMWSRQLSDSLQSGVHSSFASLISPMNGSKVVVPVYPSALLSNALFNISLQIHRQGALAADRDIINMLLGDAVRVIMEEYKDGLKNVADDNVQSILQMMFDVGLLSRIHQDSAGDELLDDLKRRVGSKVDLAQLDGHVQKYHHQVSTLLGLLKTDGDDKTLKKKDTHGVSDSQVFLPVAAQTSRFALLPIAANCGPRGQSVKVPGQ